jgi:hypothetical protein
VAALLSCKTNHAPDVPDRPVGPDYCFRDSTYVFTAVASDPDGDNVALRFDWGDSTASHWEGWFASGETVVFTHAWSDTGTYEVRVSAQDHLLTSEFSEARTVQVTMRLPPETPGEPSGPDIGGRDTSYDFQAGAGHPDWLQVAIRFAWGDGDTSDWSEFVLPYGPVEMSHSWSTPDTYLVRAQARDTYGLTSQWSEPHDIVIRPPGWSRLMMVGAPELTGDSSGFRVWVVNVGTVEDTVNWLVFSNTSEFLYMRDFRIGPDRCGYPLAPGMPGTGPGDTVHFTAPITIAPNDLVELYFADFHVDSLGADERANVSGKEFVFRFSDGSEITVIP